MFNANRTTGVNMLSRHGLTRKLIVFALPVLAQGVVQQSFNAVDIAVVGNYVGHEALAAVGSNGPVIALLVNLFMGLSLGSNVIISHYIGERNSLGVRRAVATSAMLAVICGIGMCVLGLLLAPVLLSVLDTPPEVIEKATEYLRYFALGFPGMMIFNFGSAILRSVGDTRRPFYCLIVAGIINVALNLFFVLVLHMGVEGVAISTAISNLVSAIFIVNILLKEKGDIKLDLKKLHVNQLELERILRIGLPAGIQGMVFAISNVFIQSGINTLGPETVSGSAAALTFEFYCYFVIVAFNQAAVAFISQNYGAGQYSMCRAVFKRCLWLSLAVCGVLNITIAIFSNTFVGIFTSEPSVTQIASVRLTSVLLYQFIACTYEIAGGAMRAIGYSVTPMLITVFGTCLLRIIWRCSGLWQSFERLLIIYPVSWIITGILMLVAYRIISRRVYRQSTTRIE